MKILIFNWQDIKNPLAGGAEVHLHEIFSRIAALGHDVTLYCSRFEGAPKEEIIDGIRVIREGGRSLFNVYVPLRYFTRFRHEGYDVVIDDMNKIPFYTPLYVRKPLFVIVHHLFDKSIFVETSFPLAVYVYLAERLGVAWCRWKQTPMMVVSESTKRELLVKGLREEQMYIVHNCVDHATHQRGGTRSTAPLIGYFGRLKKYKSVDHLITAFHVLHAEYPESRLIIMGDGDDRPRLEALCISLHINEFVQFTGFVSQEKKVGVLQQLWFMVNTSSKEGWGLTVIEANACGTTVVASDVPGLRDAVRDGKTGLLYRYSDTTELVSKMKMLMSDKTLLDQLSENAYQWSLTFDWNTVAKYTVGLMTQSLNRHTST